MSEKKIVKSTCRSCHGGCGVLVTVWDGVATHIEGDPASPTWGTMCPKGLAAMQLVYNPHRLKYPKKRVGERGEGKWQRISWEEAIDTIAGKINYYRDKYGPWSVGIAAGTGRQHMEYILRLARSVGTGNRIAPAHFCFAPRLSIYGITVGGRLWCDYHGWGGEYPKTIIHWAKALEHTNADGELAVWFLEALKHAKNYIHIDPRAHASTRRANLHLRCRYGTDAALALAMMNVIINEDLYDKEFVTNWTYGFDKLKERVQEYPPSRAAEICWVPEEDIIMAGRMFAIDTPGVIQIAEPLEAGNNSTSTLRAIICLEAITGNVERPGGMVNWVPPDCGGWDEYVASLPPLSEEAKKNIIGGDKHKLYARYGACHPETVFKQLKEGKCILKMVHWQGGNPLNSYANVKDTLAGIMNLEFVSSCDLFPTSITEYSDIVLPVAHWLEKDDIWDMHLGFGVSAINKAVEPVGEAKSDGWIANAIGRKIAPELWFDDFYEFLDFRLKKANITWKEFSKQVYMHKMGKDQKYYKYKTDYWRKGGGFNTPTGKVELYSTILEEMGYDPLPYFKEPFESPYSTPEVYKEYPLILSTGGRLPYYFHSEYRQIPWLRDIQPYPLTYINTETAKELGIKDGDWVWIETRRGRIRQVARVSTEIHPRTVISQSSWYYPEASDPLRGTLISGTNVLTSNEEGFDPPMGSTTFRALLCKVYKAEPPIIE